MLFQFAPAILAGINSGMYEVVRNTATGQLLGIARDKATGYFVANAVGLASNGFSINPLFAPAQLVMGGVQMFQTHKGFQKTYRMLDTLQNSVGAWAMDQTITLTYQLQGVYEVVSDRLSHLQNKVCQDKLEALA